MSPANDKMDNLISAIEKLMNRYEDVEKKLESKCNYDELSKLEQRIEHIEQRIAKYDSEMVPKFWSWMTKLGRLLNHRWRLKIMVFRMRI